VTTKLTIEAVNALPPPKLRAVARENGIDPASLNNGDPVKVREAIIAKLYPPAAATTGDKRAAGLAKAREVKAAKAAAAATAEAAPAPAQPAVAAAKPAGKAAPSAGFEAEIRESIKELMLRVATLEASVGLVAGSKEPIASADMYSELGDYLRTGDDGETELAMQLADVDEMNEKQTHQLAMLLNMSVEGNVPLRVLKTRLKPELAKVLNTAAVDTGAVKPAKGKPAAAAADPEEPEAEAKVYELGDLVKFKYDGKTYDPGRVIMASEDGEHWCIHVDADTYFDDVEPDDIVGPSTKKWKHDELIPEDFAPGEDE